MNPCPMYDSSIDSKKERSTFVIWNLWKKNCQIERGLALYLKMLKLGKLGDERLGMLDFEKLGEMSFIILELGEVGW